MKYVICNLKNRLDRNQSIDYASKLDHLNKDNIKLIIAPSSVYLDLFYPVEYSLAAQDITSIKDEVVTGEVTAKQLKTIGVDYVLIGHSERRIYKNEDSNVLINKIINAQKENLSIIYCVGENKEQRDDIKTFEVIEKELFEVLDNVNLDNIIISYEPIWAIGSGINPENEEIDQVINYIKSIIKDKYNRNIEVIYGGSVNIDNIEQLNDISSLEGFIIGSSSLDIKSLEQMIEIISK